MLYERRLEVVVTIVVELDASAVPVQQEHLRFHCRAVFDRSQVSDPALASARLDRVDVDVDRSFQDTLDFNGRAGDLLRLPGPVVGLGLEQVWELPHVE